MKKLLFVILGILFFSGCASIGDLKKRAAFDLGCPEDQLTVTQLGSSDIQGVSGCGKQITYVRSYANPYAPVWVANNGQVDVKSNKNQ